MRLHGNIVLTLASLTLAGCAITESDPMQRTTATAAYATQPIQIDGVLDEAVWSKAQAHPLSLPADATGADGRTAPVEAGTVRLAYDEKMLYAAFSFDDRDVIQESNEDQQYHYTSGDVAELFIKPHGAPCYWEFYVTPNGRKTAFFYPSRGRLGLESSLHQSVNQLVVAARVEGTLNDWRDTDGGWTAELAIPWSALRSPEGVDPDAGWLVQAGRYNYGVQLEDRELSSFPSLPETNFHRHERWAHLELAPPGRD